MATRIQVFLESDAIPRKGIEVDLGAETVTVHTATESVTLDFLVLARLLAAYRLAGDRKPKKKRRRYTRRKKTPAVPPGVNGEDPLGRAPENAALGTAGAAAVPATQTEASELAGDCHDDPL